MQQHFSERYKSVPIPPASPHSSDSDSLPNRQPRGRNHSSEMSDGMLRAMDNVLALSMLVMRTTPELMATERQRQEAERSCVRRRLVK